MAVRNRARKLQEEVFRRDPAHWAPLCDPVVKLSARTQGANFSGGTGIGTAVSEYADDMRVLWGLL